MTIHLTDTGANSWTSGDGNNFAVGVNMKNGDVVVVYFSNGGGSQTLSSISDIAGAVTWQNSARYTSSLQYANTTTFVVWYGIANADASGNAVKLTLSGTPTDNGYIAFVLSIAGANTNTPFDSNASIPAINADTSSNVNPTVTFSTTNANDMIIGFAVVYAAGGQSDTAGGTIGGTTANLQNVLDAATGIDGGEQYSADEDLVVSSVQTNATLTFVATATNSGYVVLADAVVAAPAQTPMAIYYTY